MDLVQFNMPVYVYVILIAVSMVSSFIQSSTGLGYGILFMTIIPYFFEYKLALAIMFAQYAVVLIITSALSWRKMNFKMALPCIIGSATGLIVGFLFMTAISADFMVKMLGGMLILASVYFFKFQNKVRVKPTFSKGLGFGGFSGVLTGLFGIGGPPLSIYILSATDDVMEYLATIQLSYAVGTIIGIMMHVFAGDYTRPVFGATLISLVPVGIGCIIGLKFVKKINKDIFSKGLYAFMIVIGIILILK